MRSKKHSRRYRLELVAKYADRIMANIGMNGTITSKHKAAHDLLSALSDLGDTLETKPDLIIDPDQSQEENALTWLITDMPTDDVEMFLAEENDAPEYLKQRVKDLRYIRLV